MHIEKSGKIYAKTLFLLASGWRGLWMIFTSVRISRFSAMNIDYLYSFLNYYNKDYVAT